MADDVLFQHEQHQEKECRTHADTVVNSPTSPGTKSRWAVVRETRVRSASMRRCGWGWERKAIEGVDISGACRTSSGIRMNAARIRPPSPRSAVSAGSQSTPQGEGGDRGMHANAQYLRICTAQIVA